jgi:hypothetical protein
MHQNDIEMPLAKSIAVPELARRLVSKYSFRLILNLSILILFWSLCATALAPSPCGIWTVQVFGG